MAPTPRRAAVYTKRAYERPSSRDGRRVLIDRMWPRGVTKRSARIDEWRRDLSPSDDLRRWFGHDPAKFERFRARYRMELLRHPEALADLVMEAETRPLTLVFGAKDTEHCNAKVLKELLEESLP